MKRVEDDGMWSLFDPKAVPEFVDLFGEAFERAYLEAETKKLYKRQIKARELYDDYTEARELMLSATHTEFAPWTLVDFNDQPLGRLTLLRNLLDRVPDTELPLAEIPWPPLAKAPLKERFGVLQPITNYRIPKTKTQTKTGAAPAKRRKEKLKLA
ncbi:MAG: hypothetical protein V4502_03025, partial [Pseudomonadota bacterium]